MGMLEDDLTEQRRMKERDQRIADLKKELERAYRCIRGFWTVTKRGEIVDDKTMLAYHSPTIAAACRFVAEGSLDGSEYFIGKHVSVMHEALGK